MAYKGMQACVELVLGGQFQLQMESEAILAC